MQLPACVPMSASSLHSCSSAPRRCLRSYLVFLDAAKQSLSLPRATSQLPRQTVLRRSILGLWCRVALVDQAFSTVGSVVCCTAERSASTCSRSCLVVSVQCTARKWPSVSTAMLKLGGIAAALVATIASLRSTLTA